MDKGGTTLMSAQLSDRKKFGDKEHWSVSAAGVLCTKNNGHYQTKNEGQFTQGV